MKINIKKQAARKYITGIAVLITFLCAIMFYESLSKENLLETLNPNSYSELTAPDRETVKMIEGEKICYLTFDDGPSKNTEKILDILAQYDAKATFFVIGNCICEDNRPVLERIIKEGHAIGLHANNHVFEKFYADENSFLEDYECLYKTLKEDYGVETAIFRLPGGSACTYLNGKGHEYVSKMRERGFVCFDWNVTGEDSIGTPTVYSIQKNVFDRVFKYERPIVLLHDSSIADATVDALPGIMERIQSEGYVFSTLEKAEEYIFPSRR